MDELRGRRILLADDQAMVAMLTEDVLTDAGAVVLGPVGSIAEALVLLGDEPSIDAAVLNLHLQGKPCEPVAATLAARGVPYLLTTAGWPLPARREVVLAKPYAPAELVAALAAMPASGPTS